MHPVAILAVAAIGLSGAGRPASRAAWDTLSPTTSPKLFFPGTVSRKGVVQFNSSFSDDGSLLAYTITGKDVPGYVVTQAWTGEGFEPPSRLPLDRGSVHSDPHVSPDGKSIVFASTLLDPDSGPAIGFNLWRVAREGQGWSAPRLLPIQIDPPCGKGFPSQTADGVLYFACLPEGTRDSDIYRVSPSPVGYAEPERLPAPINTPRFEGDAFVDRQERFLVFAAFDRAGGQGESDLYVSRRCQKRWTEPRNLGPTINSSGFDGSPFVTPDDRFLIFTSSRPTDGSGEPDFFNVYYVSFDLPRLVPACEGSAGTVP
jgi:WD40-like Beta Propeller Repeat